MPIVSYHGRLVNKDPAVARWRRTRKLFQAHKKLISARLLKLGFDKEQTRAWLTTPREELGGKTPKELMVPRRIHRVWEARAKILPLQPTTDDPPQGG